MSTANIMQYLGRKKNAKVTPIDLGLCNCEEEKLQWYAEENVMMRRKLSSTRRKRQTHPRVAQRKKVNEIEMLPGKFNMKKT